MSRNEGTLPVNDGAESMSTSEARYTPEDLLAIPDGKSYELVGGQLVERKIGAESSWGGASVLSPGLVCETASWVVRPA